MRTADFEALKNHILKLNGYFTTGFANAFKDTQTSAIYTRVNGNLKAIFPEDRLGNYFYIRNEPQATFTAKLGYEDCGPGRAAYDDRLTAYLVAIVQDGDEYEMIANLRNSVLRYKEMFVVPVGAIWQRENVVITEMQGFEDSEILTALTNLKGQAIVRVQLQITKEYLPNNCITEPCIPCKSEATTEYDQNDYNSLQYK